MVDAVGGKTTSRGVVSYTRNEIMTWPNAFTAFRLVAGISIFYWVENLTLVFTLAFLGAVSDGIDGLLARILGQETWFGKKLDQVTDLVFGYSLLYTIAQINGLTWYNVPIGIAIISFSIGMVYLRLTGWAVESSEVSKKRIAVQFIAAIAIIAANAFPARDSSVIETLGYAGLWYSIYLMWITFVGYLKESR